MLLVCQPCSSCCRRLAKEAAAFNVLSDEPDYLSTATAHQLAPILSHQHNILLILTANQPCERKRLIRLAGLWQRCQAGAAASCCCSDNRQQVIMVFNLGVPHLLAGNI
jgi:hypothetical protein